MEQKAIKIHSATIAVWAAVIAAGSIVPTIPIAGIGSPFSLSSVLYPLAGIFFGPVAGALCAAIGGFIGNLIAPHTAWIGPFTFIIGTVTAFTTGCVLWAKWPPVKINMEGNFVFNGAIIIYFIGTILWFTQKIGRSIIWIPIVFYGLGFIAMIAGFLLIKKFYFSDKKILKLPAIWIASFSGIVGGAAIGNFFSLLLYEIPREVWVVLTIQSPIERALFAAIAMIIGVPLLEGLRKIGIPVGPEDEDSGDIK